MYVCMYVCMYLSIYEWPPNAIPISLTEYVHAPYQQMTKAMVRDFRKKYSDGIIIHLTTVSARTNGEWSGQSDEEVIVGATDGERYISC